MNNELRCLSKTAESGLCAIRVVGAFVSEVSCLRLASAVLMEIGDGWETGKVYLPMENKAKP